jgi:hypothetical protein
MNQDASVSSKPLPHVPLTPAQQLIELLDSESTFDTDAFLRNILNIAVVADDPFHFLNRFSVRQVTHCKELLTGLQHEHLTVELVDTDAPGSSLNLVLERTASPDRPSPTPSRFTNHSDSGTVLESIAQMLKVTPPSTYQMIDEPEPPTPSPQLPMFDAATLKAAKLFSGLMSSPSMVYKADDRFLGSKRFKDDYAINSRNIRQIRPTSFSIFELAVLADTVHKHDPLYSVFQSQCYWYARMICDVVVKEYICDVVSGTQAPLTVDDVLLPKNDYLPDLSGRCSGILISGVEETVSSIIASNFKEHLRKKLDEVCFIINPEPCLLKFRYRFESDGRSSRP